MSYYPLFYQIDSGLNLSKAPIIMESASGTVASFPDGAEDLPLKRLKVGIDPVQDLHGYDNPWPAGGGKNLFDYDALEPGGIDETGADDDTATTDSRTGHINVTAEASYTISGLSDSITAFYYDENGDFLSSETVGNETITIPANAVTVRVAGTTSNFTTTTQLERGTSATTFSPYSNICSIIGWTGVNVTRAGKNIIQNITDKISGEKRIVEYRTSGSNGGYPILTGYYPAGTYCISMLVYSSSEERNANKIVWTVKSAIDGKWYAVNSNGQFTDPAVICYVGFPSTTINETPIRISVSVKINAPITDIRFGYYQYGRSVMYDELQIEMGRSFTSYEPYQGVTVPISFSSESGTVYGGTLTINQDGTGELVVDKGVKMLIGTSEDGTYTRISTGRFNLDDNKFNYYKKSGSTSGYSSIYTSIQQTNSNSQFDTAVSNRSTAFCLSSTSVVNAKTLRIKDARFDTLEELKAYFSEHPAQFVYPLDTPITTNLTVPQIRTLLGINNIWADTGDIISANYPIDTKLYVDGKVSTSQRLLELMITANHEETMKATKAYSSGDLLIVNGTLYRASASIANGATLTVGTNVTATTIASELASLA